MSTALNLFTLVMALPVMGEVSEEFEEFKCMKKFCSCWKLLFSSSL